MNKLNEVFKRVAFRLLIEGRLQNVINKYPDIPERDILYLSENDPSGNNKYLDEKIKSMLKKSKKKSSKA